MPGQMQDSQSTKSVALPAVRRQGGQLRLLLKLCRPHQWTKNVFVLAPLLFSLRLLDVMAIQSSLVATICFCFLSSAVYIFNDIIDVESDRAHPRKRSRPLASGQVSLPAAAVVASLLLAAAGGLAVWMLPTAFLGFMIAYLVNSALYCVWLKNKVIIDVMLIASGFVIRLQAGCVAIGVVATSWILVCGFTLSLVLGFGKRRTELAREVGDDHRRALQSYDPAKLDMLQAICTATCLVSYVLYTVAPETVQRHHTENLVYTIPIVAYGLFRYLFKTKEGKGGDGPAEVLLSDRAFVACGLLWVLSVAIILLTAWQGSA